MKKMMAAFAALITGLLLSFVGVSPASATGNVDYTTPKKCVTYRDIATCMSVDWSRQSDGTGVRLEGMQIYTTQGCGSLEDSGGKYDPVNAAWDNQNGTINYQYNFGAEPCDFYKDVANAGSSTGGGYVFMQLHARIDLAHDKIVYFGWHIEPDGDWQIVQQDVGDVQ